MLVCNNYKSIVQIRTIHGKSFAKFGFALCAMDLLHTKCLAGDLQFMDDKLQITTVVYRRPGFNCVVKQLRFWLFKVDCEFKDCDLRVLHIGHTCVIYTLRSNN